ncbi:hypothetical protein ITJ44_08475 [Clavibacter sp. VKM Ac-2873]|uniref:hypothetical protein n=1 Tax=Clavibacter sp. VKM Ac-2873 TaxID=2783813 RepID=UPI00188D72C7|nr:hypothetical protein [Clavibacter sp. VKM Ac-2873]MBF4618107.1 hypothetical protein [Clavibacter sp. VKM Ac-2873]
MDPALVRALEVDHHTWPTGDPRLLALRERAGRGRLAVLVVDGGRLAPSTRRTPPAVRDTPPTTGGRWVAYVPVERDGSADPA